MPDRTVIAECSVIEMGAPAPAGGRGSRCAAADGRTVSRCRRRRRAAGARAGSPASRSAGTPSRREADHGAAADAAPPVPRWESVLRAALFCTLGLLLLTPFVVTPSTVYPFIVGKALYSRTLIEIAFALWAVLALARPGYRPPRSWLLAA